MQKKKIFIAAGAVAAGLLIIIFNFSIQKKNNQEYIFDKNDNIKLKDVETYYEFIDFDDEEVKDYFKNDIVNRYTLKFFLHMDEMFKDSKDLEDNLEKARLYLNTSISPHLADKMLDLYKIYLNYQISLQGKMKSWELPKTPDEAIARLHKLQNYRREVFGMEDADAMFGAEVKSEEYSIRRNAIITDSKLYGDEKERKLYSLDNNMWGDEADSMNDRTMPYTRYQEKLRLYQKDLSEFRTKEERETKLMQFRREVFNPDQVRRIEDVDRLLADEKKVQEQYLARERAILGDSGLSLEAKEKKIREIQDAMFGDEAEAYRRGVAIETVLKKLGN